MKTKAMALSFLLFMQKIQACPSCERQQPVILRGITHGTGPQSRWDLLIVSLVAAYTITVLLASTIKLLKPGEKQTNHIKNSILNDN